MLPQSETQPARPGEVELYAPPPPVQYIGPREQVFEQVLNAYRTGEIRRYDPPTALPDGHNVLILGYPVPTPEPDTTDPARTKDPRWRDWHTYLLALGVVVGAACLAVTLLLVTLGLHAVVLWGITHATQIGIGLLVGFLAFLVGAGAVAKMRHGSPGRRH